MVSQNACRAQRTHLRQPENGTRVMSRNERTTESHNGISGLLIASSKANCRDSVNNAFHMSRHHRIVASLLSCHSVDRLRSTGLVDPTGERTSSALPATIAPCAIGFGLFQSMSDGALSERRLGHCMVTTMRIHQLASDIQPEE